MSADAERLAAALIASQRTMVLATGAGAPWAAPVYYLHREGRFLFFSSPKSRHIADSTASGRCAAAIHRDGDDWRDIEGLQMEGAMHEVTDKDEAAAVFSEYVARFPGALELAGGERDVSRFMERMRCRLYAFTPTRRLYLNNRAGFGARVEL